MPDDRIVALEDVDGDLSVDEFLQSPADVETAAREALVASATDARDVSTAQLHRPVEPEKIVRLEGCYRQDLTDEGFNPRIEKDGLNQMEWPTSWTAPLSSTTGPEGPLAIPRYVSEVRPGLELGLVVGRETRHWDGNDITEVVAGVTIGAPLTIHDELPGLEGYKMFDDAMAVGPGVTPVDAVPLDTAELRLAAAGERLATHQTTEWRFDPTEMIAHVSELLTLKPGDIVFTGDPTRVPTFVADGDIVEATIEGVGSVTVPISGDNRGEEAE
jgi:2-keto-4-pentenoate hydratase/2-oxohepta-3-ene-1,7-dioic acid hydratase in catechol pathway